MSRFIESPSSAILNVKNNGLLHFGQLKLRPPTVIGVLEHRDGLKAVRDPGNFMKVTRLPEMPCSSRRSLHRRSTTMPT